MDDALPALDQVLRSKLTFDLVWLSAVWMHVPPSTRSRAFRKLVSVLSPGGDMMVSLRHGPAPPGRPMEAATAAEIEALARRHGLQTIRSTRHPDAGGRPGISWEDAANLIRAVRDAANCIRTMPATFITFPGSTAPVFPCTRGDRVRTRTTVRLDEAFLWSFGALSVPVNLVSQSI